MGVGERDTRANAATVTVAASDSPFRTRADYVCDGTDDGVEINAAIDKIESIGGTVQLMGGTYTLHSTGIIEKQAIRLQGESLGATKIVAGTGHSLTAGLITLESVSEFTGGGVFDLSLVGDGTIDTGGTGRAAKDATVDGISAVNAGALFNFAVERCSIQKFKRGWNADGASTYCRERFVTFDSNEIWYNTVGIWMNEHINVNANDLRYNDIGIDGDLFDANFSCVRACYNRIGITGSAFGENCGVYNCFIQGGAIFANAEEGLVLRGPSTVCGVHFGTASVIDTWLTLKGHGNNISGCSFISQDYSAPWTLGASTAAIKLYTGIHNNLVTGCYFYNAGGPIIDVNTTGVISGFMFDNNTINLVGYPILSETSGQGSLRSCSISNNHIWLGAALNAPIIELQQLGSSVSGNRFCNNTVLSESATNKPTCFFKGNLSRSHCTGNNLLIPESYNVPMLDETCTTTNALVYNNSGGGAYTPIICNHGATAATARPPWPGVVQWIGSVEPTNAAANDVWISTA